jgi:hypothetical protein
MKSSLKGTGNPFLITHWADVASTHKPHPSSVPYGMKTIGISGASLADQTRLQPEKRSTWGEQGQWKPANFEIKRLTTDRRGETLSEGCFLKGEKVTS